MSEIVVCRVVKACRAAQRLAIENFQSVDIMSACIVFISLLGQDTSLLRLHLQVANQLAEYLCSQTAIGSSSEHSPVADCEAFVTKTVCKCSTLTHTGTVLWSCLTKHYNTNINYE